MLSPWGVWALNTDSGTICLVINPIKYQADCTGLCPSVQGSWQPCSGVLLGMVLGASPRVSLELSTTQKRPATINQEEQEAAKFCYHFYQPGTEL